MQNINNYEQKGLPLLTDGKEVSDRTLREFPLLDLREELIGEIAQKIGLFDSLKFVRASNFIKNKIDNDKFWIKKLDPLMQYFKCRYTPVKFQFLNKVRKEVRELKDPFAFYNFDINNYHFFNEIDFLKKFELSINLMDPSKLCAPSVEYIRKQIYSSLDAKMLSNKEFILEMLPLSYQLIEFIDKNLFLDKDFVLSALNRGCDGYVCTQIDASLLNDKEFVLEVLQKLNTSPKALVERLDSKLLNDKEIILKSFKKMSDAEVELILDDLDNNLFLDKEFFLEMLKCSECVVKRADKDLLDSKDFISEVLPLSVYTLKVASQRISSDPRFIILNYFKHKVCNRLIQDTIDNTHRLNFTQRDVIYNRIVEDIKADPTI